MAHGYLLSCFAGYLALAGTTLEFAIAVCFAAENFAGGLHRECWASFSRHFYISGFGGQTA